MALAITRKLGEELVIGTVPPTIIMVAGIDGNRVALRIDAPQSILVDRMEVHLKRMITNSVSK